MPAITLTHIVLLEKCSTYEHGKKALDIENALYRHRAFMLTTGDDTHVGECVKRMCEEYHSLLQEKGFYQQVDVSFVVYDLADCDSMQPTVVGRDRALFTTNLLRLPLQTVILRTYPEAQ